MFTFGQVAPYQSDDKFELGVSDDKRAFTVTFSDFKASFENSKKSAPSLTRVFSLIVPLEGEGKTVEIEFSVTGFILTTAGATATIVFSVNGQTSVADFVANSDQSILQKLTFAAELPSECRLCIFLLIGRDSKDPEAEAHLNVSSIDARFSLV